MNLLITENDFWVELILYPLRLVLFVIDDLSPDDFSSIRQ